MLQALRQVQARVRYRGTVPLGGEEPASSPTSRNNQFRSLVPLHRYGNGRSRRTGAGSVGGPRPEMWGVPGRVKVVTPAGGRGGAVRLQRVCVVGGVVPAGSLLALRYRHGPAVALMCNERKVVRPAA